MQFYLLHPQYLFAVAFDVIRRCLLSPQYLKFEVVIADYKLVRFIHFHLLHPQYVSAVASEVIHN